VCAGQPVEPGDVIVADDDGVVAVPRSKASAVLDACRLREEKEAASRERYRAGELSLDVQGMRERLAEQGLRYVDE
jgi:4-hydroxy-4-methyl-2-oxoglutarate aldolase